MNYKLVISEYADELLNNLIYYLIYHLKNEQAAKHLVDGVDSIYNRLETNPFQFPISKDGVRAEVVNVVGVFHQLESYPNKL